MNIEYLSEGHLTTKRRITKSTWGRLAPDEARGDRLSIIDMGHSSLRRELMVDEVCLSEALLAGAIEVFETMIFMDIRESTPRDREASCNNSPRLGAEQHSKVNTFLGSITFTGDMKGCLGICCSVSCAKAIAQNMLGMAQTEELSEAEISDAIGEVANMVMGSFKSRVQETIGTLNVSIPTVVKGQSLDASVGENASKTVINVNIADEYAAELSLFYRREKIKKRIENA
jgi:chemotaxis protein CheX